jgi:hypothetical protein
MVAISKAAKIIGAGVKVLFDPRVLIAAAFVFLWLDRADLKSDNADLMTEVSGLQNQVSALATREEIAASVADRVARRDVQQRETEDEAEDIIEGIYNAPDEEDGPVSGVLRDTYVRINSLLGNPTEGDADRSSDNPAKPD